MGQARVYPYPQSSHLNLIEVKDVPASSSWRRRASSSAVHDRFRFRILAPTSGLGPYRRLLAAACTPEVDHMLTGPRDGDIRSHGPSRTSGAHSEQSIGFNHKKFLPTKPAPASEPKVFGEVPVGHPAAHHPPVKCRAMTFQASSRGFEASGSTVARTQQKNRRGGLFFQLRIGLDGSPIYLFGEVRVIIREHAGRIGGTLSTYRLTRETGQ